MKIPRAKKSTTIMTLMAGVSVAVICFAMPVHAAEATDAYAVSENAVPAGIAVSDNAISQTSDSSVSDNSVPPEFGTTENVQPNITEETPSVQTEQTPALTEEAAEIAAPVVIDPDGLQTSNYKNETLADWAQIVEALRNLKPEELTNPDTEGKTLALQIQNVESIPVEIGGALAAADGSGYNKILQCSLKYGVVLAFNGAEDNSGFIGLNNAKVQVMSQDRGKRSVATTVRFEEHKNLGTVAALQLNLPRCAAGTKVSVYAETISVDAAGNTVVGENVCIGTTEADDNGNVEVPIQSTANYMFVYRGEKE